MPIRNRHKRGDYLMVDDVTGLTHYASEMRKQWDGQWVHESTYEPRNPQDFVRARSDPEALANVRPAIFDRNLLNDGAAMPIVGVTNISLGPGPFPAAHLYEAGIGAMIVGTNFVVR